jgi:heat shock protein HtpX
MTIAGNLFAQQEANRKASRRLVAGFIIFVAWLGFGGDIIWYLWSRNQGGSLHIFPGLGIFLFTFAAVVAWAGYKFGPMMLIKATGGREVTDPHGEKEQRLANVVDEMSIAAGARRPHLWIIPDSAPNAFATGIHASDAHIAVTQGLLDTLSRDQLQAVVGHEMGHIVNLDVRLMTLLTTLVGIVALVHNAAFRTMRFSGGGGSRRSSRSRDGGGAAGVLVIVLLVVWIISWAIAPLVTRLVVMKVGRSREFLADAMSAQFTRNPGALADALEKISGSGLKPKAIPKSSSQMCIVDPFHSPWDDREGRMADLMATHPPLRDRVSRLRTMAYQQVPGQSFGSQLPESVEHV